MLSAALLLLGVSQVNAFPQIMQGLQGLQGRDVAQPGCSVSKECNKYYEVSDADAHIPAKPNAATKLSASRTNCGLLGVCNEFDAEKQYVSTTGKHRFIRPSKTDIRGPCPGLNAAANHGYLPRNGVLDIQTTTDGLLEAYGFAPDFAAFLAVFASALDGDIVNLTWSIGGPLPQNVLSGVTGTPQGISYSHNNYEGDTSITRCDAYTNHGDAHTSSPTRFRYAWESGMDDDRYTLDKFARAYAKNTVRSVNTNPYYFAPLVSTTVVSPAAYNFVINFMSNHTKEEPAGYLDGAMFKQFFGYTGEYPNFVWTKGTERIPDNWYKRPAENLYGAAGLVADLPPMFAAYPDSFRFGGNTDGKGTYTGIDLANFTGGAINAGNVLKGDNLGCLFLQAVQEGVPLQLQGGVNDVGAAVAAIDKYMPSYFKKLQCPQLAKYDTSFFDKYPGNKYQPTAPNNAAKNC